MTLAAPAFVFAQPIGDGKKFFTVAQRGGRWWFIAPEGAPFFSIGLTHIACCPCVMRLKYRMKRRCRPLPRSIASRRNGCAALSLHLSHPNAGLGNPAYKDGTIPVVGHVASRGAGSAFQAEFEICRLELFTTLGI